MDPIPSRYRYKTRSKHSENRSRLYIFALLVLFLLVKPGYCNQQIPKESYFTYSDYLLEKKERARLTPPSNWTPLKFQTPLIGKFALNTQTILSISKFKGSIGDDLSNVNRWRNQLKLAPVSTLGSDISVKTIGIYHVKIISLKNRNQFLTIYWLTINQSHFFNKIISKTPIDSDTLESFIIGQPWAKL